MIPVEYLNLLIGMCGCLVSEYFYAPKVRYIVIGPSVCPPGPTVLSGE